MKKCEVCGRFGPKVRSFDIPRGTAWENAEVCLDCRFHFAPAVEVQRQKERAEAEAEAEGSDG